MTAPLLLSDAIQLYLSTTALFLIIGGLAILFLIVGLFLLQSLIPLHEADPLPAGKGKRRLRPLQGASTSPSTPAPGGMNYRLWRRRSEDLAPTPRIDIALDRLVTEGFGEPRVLRRLANGFLLRVWSCRDCATARDARPRDEAACVDGRARIHEACRAVFGDHVRVRETACRLQQRPVCDYEVLV